MRLRHHLNALRLHCHRSAAASRNQLQLHPFEIESNTDDICRRTSQKPSDELYKTFKASFLQLNQSVVGTSAPAQGATSLTDGLDISVLQRYASPLFAQTNGNFDKSIPQTFPTDTIAMTLTNDAFRNVEHQPHDIKDEDHTPHDSDEPWSFGTSGLTPSMMDPNSQNFSMFANQMPGYYTPTPGGTSTLYHNQAGDLHTPGFGMGLGTPLSLPTSEGTLHAGQQAAAFHGFQAHLPQHIQHQPFQNVNPFQMHQQAGYPPHHFTHHPSFEHLEGPVGESPIEDMNLDVNMHQHQHSPHMLFHSQSLQNTMQPPSTHPSGDV